MVPGFHKKNGTFSADGFLFFTKLRMAEEYVSFVYHFDNKSVNLVQLVL